MAPSSRRTKLLAHTRPRSLGDAKSTNLSSKVTRNVIRQHHNLHKQLAKARAAKDNDLSNSLQAQIEASGGLVMYQKASAQGQSIARGGDSSRILMEWMQTTFQGKNDEPQNSQAVVNQSPSLIKSATSRLRLLEIGALRTDNACARSGRFDMVRIDLHSQHPNIQEQDFMERPLPRNDEALASQGFDVISLSLVLNYVSEPAERGRMLERTTRFLRLPAAREDKGHPNLPGLFLVLPAPCVCNSRYLDESRLVAIMQALGYDLISKKYSKKLAYYYWHFSARPRRQAEFPKIEVAAGSAKNNFAIVLK